MNSRRFAILVLCGLFYCTEGQKIKVINGYNPGRCDDASHGQNVLVKDRSDNDKELMCVLENGIYRWIAVDGSSTLGEYIKPAYDCTNILNENPQAMDGFYFINFHFKQAIKVWCDMATDGGGFILIGRKKTPETWTVPSNSNPLSPYEKFAHWLSNLGNAPIQDFRVQMATRDDLSATRAHWMYKLKARRPLKELMQKSSMCGYNGAGIADIAYVKDLETGQVVSHDLACSKFGFGHQPQTGFGWASMNKCLEKPCPYGYAKKSEGSAQHDFHGAFSYSVQQSVAGMEKGATAFVGCDDNKCCGCFGPVGGRKDYCYRSCDNAINGGQISKNVYTWFWIRSSLPKIVWDKCMHFQKKQNGKLIWYKFVGENVVPIKGRCNENRLSLLDGIAVVPKGQSINQTVPRVSGILAYGKANKEIYVNADGKWKALAQKNEIQKELPALVKPSLKHLEDKILGQRKEILKDVNNEVKPKFDKLHERLNAQNKSIVDKINVELKSHLDNIDRRLDAQNKSITDKLSKEVKPKLDKMSGRLDRLDAQNRTSSQRIAALESEIKSLKDGLVSVKPTQSPLSECSPTSHINPNGYKWLKESSRNTGYGLGFSCDRTLSAGWYRFGGPAGTKIASSCVPTHKCGTSAPGWMIGAHPTVAEGKVARKVGFHWQGNCQRWVQDIQVLNCVSFYVYYLGPPSACHLRFCGSFI